MEHHAARLEAVSLSVDADGDGTDDLIVGAQGADRESAEGCGEAYVIVVDPVNRLVSCELRAPYASLARVEEGVPTPYDNPKAGH